ncbi:MAG: transcription termination factor NusA [Patescibacteria group bacterium]|nr:transcription termination factor NusA [Patescibacteria group bacterium]
MQPKFLAAINQIAEEKNIPKEVILETVEAALAAAYKKDYGEKDQQARVKIDEETGDIKVFVTREVVKDVENSNLEISLEDAKKIKKDAKIGDMVEKEEFPEDFGRIAAQTAKQIIIQRIREAERDMVFSEYKDKEGELVNASVQRIEGNTVIVDLGQASGVLFANEQVDGERYYIGQRLKVYIVKVEQSTRGPQVVVSRSHPGVVKRLFETEVPEIEAGIVQIKAIAREAGHRTKMAVDSTDENVDPVGSCVGQRGIRVQAVLSELGEEKIDVILWKEDPKEFITNALSPAKVIEVELNEEEKKAKVIVPEDQLSLAIGKNGQNVRLAAKLTGWNIDIEERKGEGVGAAEEAAESLKEEKQPEEVVGKNEEIEALEEEKPIEEKPEVEETKEQIGQETEVKAVAETKEEEPVKEKAEKPETKPKEKAEKSEEEQAVKEVEDILEQDTEPEAKAESVSATSDMALPDKEIKPAEAVDEAEILGSGASKTEVEKPSQKSDNSNQTEEELVDDILEESGQ